MADWLLGLILAEPKFFRSIGRGLAGAGAWLMAIGLFAHNILDILGRLQGRVGLRGPGSLAEMYPTLPTWWVPETWLGYTFAVVLVVAGFALARLAKQLQKY
jgi:hypothetical protein